jgi:hypothetical protein
MSKLFCIATLLFASTTFATTSIIFSNDGSKATITMLAFTANPDATGIFKTMNVPLQDIDGKLVKQIDFKTSDGAPSFDLNCVFSKIVAGTGSCILVLQASANLQMDPSAQTLTYTLHGADAKALAAAFTAPTDGHVIFHSTDNLLDIQAAHESDDDFVLTYGK